MPPSATLEKPARSAGPTHSRPPFAKRLLISTIRFVVVALIAAFVGGGWYLARKGFGRQWRALVVEELHKRGVEASVRRLTLDPFRGLVAQDVRIFDYKNRENTLALISEVSLDINYAALLHKKPFLNALDVRNGRLSLPVSGSKTRMEQAQLKNFHAHIYFPPEQIFVSQAEGVFCGIRISATGHLFKKDDYKPSAALTEEEWQQRLALLGKVVNEIQKFNFPSEPSIQIKFSGDLAEMENARVEANVRGERIRRGNYEARDLSAIAEFVNQRLSLSQLEWKDSAGAFSARGSWGRAQGDVNFQARSDLDLKSLLNAFGLDQQLADTTFTTPPVVEISGNGTLGEGRPQVKVIGQFGVASFAYRGMPFTGLRANFSWDGEHTLVRDVHVQSQGGQLSAELFDAPNDFRLDLDSNINPSGMRAFVSPEMQKFLAEWEFAKPPTVKLSIKGQSHQPETWQGEGTIALDRTRFRGSWMKNASAKVRFGDGAVSYENLKVTRDEGTASGSFTYDFRNHEVRVTNMRSSLYPAEIAPWIDPDLYKTVTPYKFKRAPNVTCNGVYQFAGRTGTKLDLTVDAPNGMDYVFIGKTLPFEHIAGKLLFTHDRLQLIDIKGGLMSGVVKGNADISLAKGDSRYKADLQVKKIDFPRLTDLYWQYKTAQGELAGEYEFSGVGSDPRKMKGKGDVRVSNGDVFAIPVFGPLSGMLASILPGTGYSVAHKAHATFTIGDSIIHTDDFEASGDLFSMLGHGDIHFLDDKLNFDVRMSMKGPGMLLAPVYKLFEYTGEGSLKKPDWHAKRF